MYTDVIIGFDGSPSGRDALALGRRLAEAAGAVITVVCVHPYMALTADVEADAAVELSWRKGAQRTLDEARSVLSGMPTTTFRAMAESSPARALHEAANEADAALIVLGSTHRNGVGRVLPGTTADQVLHVAPCAVAVAPAGYAARDHAERLGVVGAAVDGGEETERVARVAARIARGAESRLRLISVIERHYTQGALYAGNLGYRSLRTAMTSLAEDALQRGAAAAGAHVHVETRLSEGAPAEQLIVESHDLDLLVVGSRGFGPLRRVVLGTVGAAVVRAAACPVLIFPRRTAEELDDVVASLARAAAT
jgi:nucleotide-binding universal stress UspA family protein